MTVLHLTLAINRLATEDTVPPLNALAQYGVAGVISVIFLWFGWAVYKREIKRADEAETEVKRLNTLITEKYVPALESATHALRDVTEMLHDFRRGH